MALKVWEGFDHYSSSADLLARSGFLQWQIISFLSPGLTFQTGLTGFGKALKVTTSVSGGPFTATAFLRGVWQDRNQEAFFGMRVLLPLGTNAGGLFVTLVDTVAGTGQIVILFNEQNYAVQIYRGTITSGAISGTLLYASPNNAWIGNTAIYLEIGAKIANSGGYVTVRMNGVVIATITGVDTQNTANAWFDAIDLEGSPISGTQTFILDDIYYGDTTSGPGSYPGDTFAGDVRVSTLFATGDDSVQWTPNSGANNYSRINEQAMDGDTSYVTTSGAGNQDTYDFDPLISTIGIIYGLQITFAGRKDDGGPRTVKSVMKSGGTTDFGADHSLGNTYAYFTDMWILDPNTSANWTRTNVNAVAAGINLVA
jgi:hypothetical protein